MSYSTSEIDFERISERIEKYEINKKSGKIKSCNGESTKKVAE
ncbi:MAG: hypothetical protein QXM43_09690 [Desulfurococcaceae archaeon]